MKLLTPDRAHEVLAEIRRLLDDVDSGEAGLLSAPERIVDIASGEDEA